MITTAQLREYLDASGVEYTSVAPLDGGTANFVWRFEYENGGTAIVKHAEPFVKDNRAIAFPAERMDVEAMVLSSLPPVLAPADAVRMPAVHRYDAANHVLTMDDGGARTLKEAYTSLDVKPFGDALGKWLASLHEATPEHDLGEGGNLAARAIYRYSYAHLAGALEAFGQDVGLGGRVDSEFGSLLQSDDEVVCHGDFWPGNVLIGADCKMTIVDWEMVRRGCGATDVAQFAAEAFLLDKFRGEKGLLPAFLSAYRAAAGKPSREFFKRVAIHFGTHVAFWPTRVRWGTREETAECVRLGAYVLQHALDDDWTWFEQGVLTALRP
ncbi:kinase-like domain-containing protein [Lineolata rhizophorae]|uniref:Kinase-like domain-containing protein n=1 Tax=Lineolata rhizophorae TaxID=578093 RepID=A0A6A6NZ27_9PEZI|nr:kinase-like domain-containing protein [Lineolata rhizophorae]